MWWVDRFEKRKARRMKLMGIWLSRNDWFEKEVMIFGEVDSWGWRLEGPIRGQPWIRQRLVLREGSWVNLKGSNGVKQKIMSEDVKIWRWNKSQSGRSANANLSQHIRMDRVFSCNFRFVRTFFQRWFRCQSTLPQFVIIENMSQHTRHSKLHTFKPQIQYWQNWNNLTG